MSLINIRTHLAILPPSLYLIHPSSSDSVDEADSIIHGYWISRFFFPYQLAQ